MCHNPYEAFFQKQGLLVYRGVQSSITFNILMQETALAAAPHLRMILEISMAVDFRQ